MLGACFDAATVVAMACSPLARRTACRLLPVSVEKLAERKTRAAAADALLAFAKACGPAWVLEQATTRDAARTRERGARALTETLSFCIVRPPQVRVAALGAKNPKVLVESLGWARECLAAFSAPATPAAELLKLAVPAADHRDAAARDGALSLLIDARHALGAALLSSPLLAELRDGPRKALEAQSAEMGAAPEPPKPSRAFRHAAPPAATDASGGSASAAASAEASALDELCPRVEIMKKVPAGTLKRLGDKHWKARTAKSSRALPARACRRPHAPIIRAHASPDLPAAAPYRSVSQRSAMCAPRSRSRRASASRGWVIS